MSKTRTLSRSIYIAIRASIVLVAVVSIRWPAADERKARLTRGPDEGIGLCCRRMSARRYIPSLLRFRRF